MKTSAFPAPRLTAAAALLVWGALGLPAQETAAPRAPAPAEAAANTLYVTIDTSNPAAFERSRYSRENGQELIVATLRAHAAREAEFAGFSGHVVVLDPDTAPPAGADVLRLTWIDGTVTADLRRATGESSYLGVVSKTSIAFHPDHDAMDREIRRAGMPDLVRDARLRVSTRMQFYLALQRAARELQKPRG